jgi:hypothetical protein
MEQRSIGAVAAVVSLAALCGCAGIAFPSHDPIERLDESGVSAPVLTVEAGEVLQFHNADRRPHQIYSNDCNELSSPLLRPTETYSTVLLGIGDKLCHFQDLLAPLSSSYSGTIHVHDAVEARRLETAD